MDTKYAVLLNILDGLRKEAPQEFTSYHSDTDNIDSLNIARSKAFIHLFLKVRFGIVSFLERHELITEGPQDGGVDAYYIDRENKKLFLIQSKFRINPQNFSAKKITATDLVSMEVQRILRGDKEDSRGVRFSAKIEKLQENWSSVSDQAHYEYKVIILGNLENYTREQVERLVDSSQYDVFDFKKTYKELVFPLCSGTYYNPKEIKITIDLAKKEQSTLKQEVDTKLGTFPIRVLFVPTKEIGRIMSRYKNSILKHNPRNYLSLSANKVNRKIQESILNTQANDFAMYNNGITIIANNFRLMETTGEKNVGQVIMTNPQIINGGQTAYVLSRIYEDHQDDLTIFEGKEVMLKVIILTEDSEVNTEFIEYISAATNQQTRIDEADRRSNDKSQLALENLIYDEFGYFYERKRGEFYNGIDKRYIAKEMIVGRFDFLRAYLAWSGDASNARRSGAETLFKEKRFNSIVNLSDFKKMFFAYKVLTVLEGIPGDDEDLFGSSFKVGKMAIISAVGAFSKKEKIEDENIEEVALQKINKAASLWPNFIKTVSKAKGNASYRSKDGSFDYDKYYKGSTVNADIRDFFTKES